MNRVWRPLLYGACGVMILILLWVGVKAGSGYFAKSGQKQPQHTEGGVPSPTGTAGARPDVQPSAEATGPGAGVQPSAEATGSGAGVQQSAVTTPTPDSKQDKQPQAAESTGDAPTVSYDDLIAGTENSLKAMESEAANYFFDTAAQYLQTKDADEKNRLKKEAQGRMAQFDSRFNGLMKTLESQLRENGYDTSKVQEFRSAYQSEKASGLAQLGALKQ